MDDEVAHVGVIDGLLCLCLPSHEGRSIIRIDSDNVELFQVSELGAAEFGELAANNEMQQLLWCAGVGSSHYVLVPYSIFRKSPAASEARDVTRTRPSGREPDRAKPRGGRHPPQSASHALDGADYR